MNIKRSIFTLLILSCLFTGAPQAALTLQTQGQQSQYKTAEHEGYKQIVRLAANHQPAPKLNPPHPIPDTDRTPATVAPTSLPEAKLPPTAGIVLKPGFKQSSPLLLVAANAPNQNTGKLISFLLHHGCSLNTRDAEGNTVLHLIVRHATDLYRPEYKLYPLNILEELLDHGADFSVENAAGLTPLAYALEHTTTAEGSDNLAYGVILRLQQAAAEARKRHETLQACG